MNLENISTKYINYNQETITNAIKRYIMENIYNYFQLVPFNDYDIIETTYSTVGLDFVSYDNQYQIMSILHSETTVNLRFEDNESDILNVGTGIITTEVSLTFTQDLERNTAGDFYP